MERKFRLDPSTVSYSLHLDMFPRLMYDPDSATVKAGRCLHLAHQQRCSGASLLLLPVP